MRQISNVIPSPARNMPVKGSLKVDKFQLYILNQAQLKAIKNVKLKHIPQQTKTKIYEPRHPVLKELLSKRMII